MQDPTLPVILRGNCFELMEQLAESSVDLLLTDPPYGTTNLAFDKISIDWQAWWAEVHRVCKPSAIMLCFAAQPFATDLINSNRKNFRYDMVWQKSNPVGYLSANVRPLRSHELMLVFCRKFGRVKGEMQSVYNPQMTEGAPYVHRSRARPATHYSATKDIGTYRNPGKRFPTSVLTYGRDAVSLHPTQKPEDLLRKLLRQYSHPGAVVLDCFMGSGSTGAACLLEGRRFVGMEMDADYFEIARKRLCG